MILQRPHKRSDVVSDTEKEEDMFAFIGCILLMMVFFKALGFAFRLGWGILKIALYLIFLPAIVFGMIFGGLIFIVLPIIVIAAIVAVAVRA